MPCRFYLTENKKVFIFTFDLSERFEILETPRLLLKKVTVDNLLYLFEKCDEDIIMKELGLDSHEAFLKEKQKFEKGFSDYRRTILMFKLIEKHTGCIIGNCGYHNWQHEHSRAEIGYDIMLEAFKRQGYMSEALKVVINYGFTNMNLIRIEACVSPNNEASLKLVQKFKFEKEGYLRQHYVVNGNAEDSVFYALLKRDYKP